VTPSEELRAAAAKLRAAAENALPEHHWRHDLSSDGVGKQ
jgi:hypothetical protein